MQKFLLGYSPILDFCLNFTILLSEYESIIFHESSVDASSDYQLTLQLLKENWSTKTVAVMVATPSNPTGTLLEKSELIQMARFVKEQGGYLIVDEIYHGLVYEGEVNTALAIDDRIIVINSFSK